MILFPPCKINLGLQVLGKRADGFHELESLMFQVPLRDVLEIVPAAEFAFTSSGLEIPGNEAANLCVRAYRMLAASYAIAPVHIHLHKIIPMGGGLGGGSADGAYALLGLNQLFSLGLSVETLQLLAAKLGSDCPLFIREEPQIARGRGEILEPVSLSLGGYFLKLVNTGIHVSTKDAFAQVQFADGRASVQELIQQPVTDWKDTLFNSFEASVFALHPSLREVKEKLYAEGAVYAAMSGSGSTLFGIYKTQPALTFSREMAVFEQVIALQADF